MLVMAIVNFIYPEDLKSPYPIQQCRGEGYLAVSSKHQIYYALYGNPEGLPVVILHGGPGMGSSDKLTRYFDLTRFNVIMFDQRGAMRSKPFACMEENTTWDLIEDIEKLRKHLSIDRWVVFGGSWGSLLAILYGEEYPQSCVGFILTGVFLGREKDINLFSQKGKTYQDFISLFPEEERKDLLSASYSRVMDPDPEVHMPIARAFFQYIFASTIYTKNPSIAESLSKNDQLSLSMSRAVFHYAVHKLFLSPDQALSQIGNISHLPGFIIQGQSDINCPCDQAKLLHERWKNSHLWLIEEGGHAGEDPNSVSSLIKATEMFLGR